MDDYNAYNRTPQPKSYKTPQRIPAKSPARGSTAKSPTRNNKYYNYKNLSKSVKMDKEGPLTRSIKAENKPSIKKAYMNISVKNR